MPSSAHPIDSPSVKKYPRAAVALHWLVAVAMLIELGLGWWMLEVPKTPPGLRAGWFNLHKSIGLTLGFVGLLCLVWRITHADATDNARLPAWQQNAAGLAHGALWVCLLVVPLSGYLGSSFTRYPVRYFGIVLPSWNRDWPAAKELMSSIHETAVWLFVALLALHIAAALWHWWQRDGVAARMGLPSLSRNLTR